MKEKMEIEKTYYIASAREFMPNSSLKSEKIFIFKNRPKEAEVEPLVKYDKLGDAQVDVYEVKFNKGSNTSKQVDEFFFRFSPRNRPEFKLKRFDVKRKAGFYYEMTGEVNGKKHKKEVSQEIYQRYRSGLYTDDEFVILFAPEWLK